MQDWRHYSSDEGETASLELWEKVKVGVSRGYLLEWLYQGVEPRGFQYYC
jgi:hypothetical protein